MIINTKNLYRPKWREWKTAEFSAINGIYIMQPFLERVHSWRRGRKNRSTRGSKWLQGNIVLCTQQGTGTSDLTVDVTPSIRPARTPISLNPSKRRQVEYDIPTQSEEWSEVLHWETKCSVFTKSLAIDKWIALQWKVTQPNIFVQKKDNNNNKQWGKVGWEEKDGLIWEVLKGGGWV